MKLFENLKFYRKKNNLTQKELSKLLNVSDKTISSWENGRTSPDMDMLKKLSIVFNISIDCLLKKDDISNNTNYIARNYDKFKVYKNLLICINILLIIFTYFELTELFSFHFPIINVFNLLSIFLSWLFVKSNVRNFIKKKNILSFFFIFFLNVLLSHVGSNIFNIINGHNEVYIKSFIIGRFFLLTIFSLLIFLEKDLIKTIINKNRKYIF
ncbi:XRE family transcriptional regulator [Apilactobacillus micheneri]|uniref:helix-turn-helix domain-containing protein n=1 Tax=Apilactobacillus micheneri TaxID=1899430 RepID=UPI0011284C06|nr:helix-turn-helix transcriptional regulator [Apilactobacillus micheneri]TPR41220.1 XRE family transcriptional regulator [Apilactobacillus micheneri]